MEKKLVQRARIAKPDLDLGRMHVDVDACRVQLEKQHERRMPFLVQHVVKSLADCVSNQAVAHEAPVDEKILIVACAAIEGRRGDQAGQAYTGRLLVERQAGCLELLPEQGNGALPKSLLRQSPLCAAVVLQRHRYLWAGQCDALEHLFAMAELGAFRA